MAAYSTDLNVLSACDAVTGWSELAAPHASGSAPAADTENYFHNSISVSQATGQATGTGAGIQYLHGSALTWTASSNWVFLAWVYYAAPTNLLSWASGGVRIGIGDADNVGDVYNAMGNDFGTYPYGGWQNTAIDPEFATPDATIGTVGTGYQNFVVLPNITAKITKGAPLAVDVVRYGRGQLLSTGTGCTFTGMATDNDNATSGRWGLFAAQAGSYLWKGLLQFGEAATSCTFTDDNKIVRLEDTPRVLAGFNAIEIYHTSSDITFDAITILGVQTSITGSAPVSQGDFEVVDNATVVVTGCLFVDMGTFIFNDGTNPNTVTDTVFRRCRQVTQTGSTITGCTFDSSNSTTSLVVDDITGVTGNTFISDTANHAVDLGAFTLDETITWNNELSGYVTGVTSATTDAAITTDDTTNAAILCNVSSLKKLIINVATGATVPSIKNAGAGDVAVNSSVTLTVTVVDSANVAITGSQVRIEETDGTTVDEGAASTGAGSNVFVGSFSGTTPINVIIKVRRSSTGSTRYIPVRTAGQITSGGLTTTVSMATDSIVSA